MTVWISRRPFGSLEEGEFLFGGKFLDCMDNDISMHKRAKEVADRLAKPRFSDATHRQRVRPFTSFSSRGRGQPFRAHGRGFRRSVRGRGTTYGRGTPVWSASSTQNRKWLYGRVSGLQHSPSRGSHFPFLSESGRKSPPTLSFCP